MTRRDAIGAAACSVGAAVCGLTLRDDGFRDGACGGVGGEAVRYAFFVPRRPPPASGYPAIVYLHGSGERGRDGRRPLTSSMGEAVRARAASFGFFALFPQAVSCWSPIGVDAMNALRCLRHAGRECPVDPARVCLTGYSMGGCGVWALAAAEPRLWSCMVPVAGGGDPDVAELIRDIPCRCYHGSADTTIPAGESRRMVAAVQAVGGRPHYIEWAGARHDVDRVVYEDQTLYDWIGRQRRPPTVS